MSVVLALLAFDVGRIMTPGRGPRAIFREINRPFTRQMANDFGARKASMA
jgi:hypothetical protein